MTFSKMAECCYAECHYAECHYAECHYVDCHYAECHYDKKNLEKVLKTFSNQECIENSKILSKLFNSRMKIPTQYLQFPGFEFSIIEILFFKLISPSFTTLVFKMQNILW